MGILGDICRYPGAPFPVSWPGEGGRGVKGQNMCSGREKEFIFKRGSRGPGQGWEPQTLGAERPAKHTALALGRVELPPGPQQGWAG